MLKDVIKADFTAKLDEAGVAVVNKKTGHQFRALVVASEQMASFSIGKQELQEVLSATCLVEDTPTTGDTLEIEGDIWAVTGVKRRPGSPIRRFAMQLNTAADYGNDQVQVEGEDDNA